MSETNQLNNTSTPRNTNWKLSVHGGGHCPIYIVLPIILFSIFFRVPLCDISVGQREEELMVAVSCTPKVGQHVVHPMPWWCLFFLNCCNPIWRTTNKSPWFERNACGMAVVDTHLGGRDSRHYHPLALNILSRDGRGHILRDNANSIFFPTDLHREMYVSWVWWMGTR